MIYGNRCAWRGWIVDIQHTHTYNFEFILGGIARPDWASPSHVSRPLSRSVQNETSRRSTMPEVKIKNSLNVTKKTSQKTIIIGGLTNVAKSVWQVIKARYSPGRTTQLWNWRRVKTQQGWSSTVGFFPFVFRCDIGWISPIVIIELFALCVCDTCASVGGSRD